MKYKEEKIFISIVISFVSLLLIGGAYLGAYGCQARWENSNIKSKFSFRTGCLIEVSPDRWIPESNYREVVK